MASLPLLGYDVRRPDASTDDIQKDFVFKLVFKNHVYFFRAESQFTFNRYRRAVHKLCNTITGEEGGLVVVVVVVELFINKILKL